MTQKILRCDNCGKEIIKCDGCGNKFEKGDDIYCILIVGVGYEHCCEYCVDEAQAEYGVD